MLGALYIIEKLRRGAPDGEDPTRITLDFPGTSVRLPAQDAGLFCAAAELAMADAFRALQDHVRGQLGDVAV